MAPASTSLRLLMTISSGVRLLLLRLLLLLKPWLALPCLGLSPCSPRSWLDNNNNSNYPMSFVRTSGGSSPSSQSEEGEPQRRARRPGKITHAQHTHKNLQPPGHKYFIRGNPEDGQAPIRDWSPLRGNHSTNGKADHDPTGTNKRRYNRGMRCKMA